MSTRVLPSKSPSTDVPPLEQGDHLTREEFEKRYDATPDLKKAERIEGIVHLSPPVRWESHGSLHLDLAVWIGTYKFWTPGVQGGENTTVRLDLDNDPQPDGLLFIEPALGGSAQIDDGYIVGAPEFVAEVSSSTVSFDMNTKLRVYQRNSVREYLVWRVRDRAIDWFELKGTSYVRLNPDANGIICSKVLPGLWLDTDVLIASDGPKLLNVLNQGIASPEHAAFVATLKSRKA